MCDEAKMERWAKEALSRRQFGVLAGAAAVSACAPGQDPADESETAGATAGELPGVEVSFPSDDGTIDARFFAAAGGAAAPAIIHWPDIAGVRRSHLEMAQRLSGEGYSVLVVNPYYRDEAGVIWEDFATFAGNGGWDRAREMRQKLTSFAIKRDTEAIVRWLDAQDSVDSERGIGAEGYCMGGPFTVYSAHAEPARVKAAASFHGGGLVRDDDESPHKLLPQTDANFLIAIAQDDDAEAPDDKTVFAAAAAAAGRPAVVDVFAGDHGWTVPDSPAYAEAAAERAYAAKLELYRGAL